MGSARSFCAGPPRRAAVSARIAGCGCGWRARGPGRAGVGHVTVGGAAQHAPPPPRGWSCRSAFILVGLGAGPAAFEGVGNALDHGGGDVAVDAPYPSKPVAEPFGLGDFGDVVFDEPGLVGVAQVVEVHAGDDRWLVGPAVAVDGRREDPAGHGGAAQQSAARAGEHEVVVVAVQQGLQLVDEERWEVDVAGGVAGFGGPR